MNGLPKRQKVLAFFYSVLLILGLLFGIISSLFLPGMYFNRWGVRPQRKPSV